MDEQVNTYRVTKVLGLGETSLGDAIVFEHESGQQFALVADAATWFECSGLFMNHAIQSASGTSKRIPRPDTRSLSDVRNEDGKVMLDLGIGESQELRVAMSPRRAQRLRDQIDGVLELFRKRIQN